MSNKTQYTKEDSYSSLERVNFWISNVDAKISFILIFVSVYVFHLFSKGMPDYMRDVFNKSINDIINISTSQTLSIFILLFTYFMAILSLITLLLALIGNINNKVYSEYGLKSKSVLFFGSISNLNYAEYRNNIRSITDYNLIEDINSQVYINSKIASLKFKIYNISVKLLIISLISYFICEIFNVI